MARQKFNQSKNNRYQQTWHTIEFSNNRSLIQSSTTTNHNGQQIAPEQLFKLTRTSHTKQTSPEPPTSTNSAPKHHRKPAIRKGESHRQTRISGGNSNNFTHPQPPKQIGTETPPKPLEHKGSGVKTASHSEIAPM
ncbi:MULTISPECIES: hypothetical protein [Paenarthrobacter]|uniref:Uncharacterized protein n=3 Tax=Paenarthrobacter ureafaciens TaxID=37931 RepID=A0AAX3EH94_PAEUR|nr:MULTISPECIES: hypothetical protein [Paenarthrobacter]MDO5866425.1 hypothetical protein [Paenarthrobacter sp. SD-2]MDO5877524.1 hypothetical protein [Paenarthrobacter sp. SD-1]QMU84029.1 hypothetical protein FV140_19575 [Paenarthrobacter ureafaciens]UYV92711.1 hypothetical protein NL395_19755 [Paenarthrobacter ureafaciens]UYV97246.1 hypothetical protein NL394_19785 [Paenarthrobacter ureafaciens]